jgi:hypothetical protein
MQTAVLQLYDPGRSQAPARKGEAATWAQFERDLVALRQQWTARQGEGLRILTGTMTSPTQQRFLRFRRAGGEPRRSDEHSSRALGRPPDHRGGAGDDAVAELAGPLGLEPSVARPDDA